MGSENIRHLRTLVSPLHIGSHGCNGAELDASALDPQQVGQVVRVVLVLLHHILAQPDHLCDATRVQDARFAVVLSAGKIHVTTTKAETYVSRILQVLTCERVDKNKKAVKKEKKGSNRLLQEKWRE